MENTQRILILYVIMLSLNCLNAEERATAAKRLLFINAAELTQDRYFENTLASKLKSKCMLLWRRDFAFVSTENKQAPLTLQTVDHQSWDVTTHKG